jgi:Domain of unknown function (DUF4844)
MRLFFLRLYFAAMALCTVSGVSHAQGTSMPNFSPEQRSEALSKFIAKKKFVAEGTYPGATNEADRKKYEATVNELARRLLKLRPEEQTKTSVLNQFKPTMNAFEQADSEERDRFLNYLEDLMGIFNIESSDGLLNKWRYGFDPNESFESRNTSALASMSIKERELLAKFQNMNAQTAKSMLIAVLGQPSADTGDTQMWFLESNATAAISLSVKAGVATFSWMAKDRFFYARRL